MTEQMSAEERWIYDTENACPYCGGSGHKGDVKHIDVKYAPADQLDAALARIDAMQETVRRAEAIIDLQNELHEEVALLKGKRGNALARNAELEAKVADLKERLRKADKVIADLGRCVAGD